MWGKPTPVVAATTGGGRWTHKSTTDMNANGKSDDRVVPTNLANKAATTDRAVGIRPGGHRSKSLAADVGIADFVPDPVSAERSGRHGR